MSKLKLDLKDPWLAAVLAWLVPGLGHFYQRRFFKSAVYFVCILGTFFTGMALGDGQVVHWTWRPERKTYGYFAQVLVGLPALPALAQAYRLPPDAPYFDRRDNPLEKPLAGPFEGMLLDVRLGDGSEVAVPVTGQIEIVPGEFKGNVTGQFRGEVDAAEAEIGDPAPPGFEPGARVELELSFLGSTERAIYPSPDRHVVLTVSGRIEGSELVRIDGTLAGEVIGARSILNRYAAPLDDPGLQMANGDLGKYFELGLVYTWIAGLLNLLAIWDAREGPAYGIGDEEEEGEGAQADSGASENSKPAETATAAAPPVSPEPPPPEQRARAKSSSPTAKG